MIHFFLYNKKIQQKIYIYIKEKKNCYIVLLWKKYEKIYKILWKNTQLSLQRLTHKTITISYCKHVFKIRRRLLNNTCVKHNFKRVHVSNLFWSREYNSAKEICKYPSFSKVEGNYPLDLKIIWSSAGEICCSMLTQKKGPQELRFRG